MVNISKISYSPKNMKNDQIHDFKFHDHNAKKYYIHDEYYKY